MKPLFLAACLLAAVFPAFPAGGQQAAAPYLGQAPPGEVPELFAPGIVNTGMATRDMTISPDGRLLCFRVNDAAFRHSAIVCSRLTASGWSRPDVPSFADDPRWKTLEPHIAPDGRRLFFTSDRPASADASKPAPMGIWVVGIEPNGWSAPRRLPDSINGPDGSFFPTLTRDGTLYFARDGQDGQGEVWRARPGADGALAPPEKLPAVVQAGSARYNPFVAPDGRLMILAIAGLKDSLGGLDYYALSADETGQWSEPVNLGAPINDDGHNISASLSPDGRYLFFSSTRPSRNPFPGGARLTYDALQRLALAPGASGAQAIYWVRWGHILNQRISQRPDPAGSPELQDPSPSPFEE
jgi:Tol biopolymer transport system component